MAAERVGRQWSIPACAGEPWARKQAAERQLVYPRVCGGTPPHFYRFEVYLGLSPRVRGNPPDSRLHAQTLGSIPACAGEPTQPPRQSRSGGVYPRVCGGTASQIHENPADSGLSPRVRGNHRARTTYSETSGSIPACAGEPRTCARRPLDCRVYPRVCGGTEYNVPQALAEHGLSPRVRGNPGACGSALVRVRSIPACAGEPYRIYDPRPSSPVYPRVCGGTPFAGATYHSRSGLSPRVRGNPSLTLPGLVEEWSIPACAGEPRPGYRAQPATRVYPRVCGGTVLREG